MDKLFKYQINSIKTIFGHDTYIDNDDVSEADIINFYKENMNFYNSIEIPDMLKNMCSRHALTKNSLIGDRNNETDTRISINRDIANQNKSLYKLLREKDINWENAYLPNLEFEDFNLKKIEYNKFTVNTNTSPATIDKELIEDTTFANSNDMVPKRIYNTYDLLKVIDYLFLRLKALNLLLNQIKEQKKEISKYKTYINNSNNTNN